MTNIHTVRQRKIELEKRAQGLIDKQTALLEKAETEKRDFTSDETKEFEANRLAMAGLKPQIEREDYILGELAEQLEREKKAGAVTDPNVTAAERAGTPTAPKHGFQSLGEQLIAVVRAARNPEKTDARLEEINRLQASVASDGSMGIAVPSEGGFLVQKDFAPEILQRTYATGEILRRVRKMPISSNANGLKINTIDEDSRADGSRMGGILAYWINEADTLTSSRPKFRRIELNLNKLIALCYATEELLQDAAALEAWIMQNLPVELAFRTEDAIFNGTGAGQPLGVNNSGAALQIAKAATDSGAVLSAADVIAMWTRFWAPGLANSIANIQQGEGLTPPGSAGQSPAAAWFVDQSVLAQLFGMTVGSGTAVILLYHPPGYYGLPGPYGQMLGLPVIPVEHCAVLGTPGDIVLADLTQYLMIDKGAPQAASSIHVRFLTDETTFRFTYRVDGQPLWKKPLTPKSGGPTLSPFVTVAVRS